MDAIEVLGLPREIRISTSITVAERFADIGAWTMAKIVLPPSFRSSRADRVRRVAEGYSPPTLPHAARSSQSTKKPWDCPARRPQKRSAASQKLSEKS